MISSPLYDDLNPPPLARDLNIIHISSSDHSGKKEKEKQQQKKLFNRLNHSQYWNNAKQILRL